MNLTERKKQIRQFVKKWGNEPGDEDRQSQLFWIDFMRDVCGIDDTSYIEFEKPVRLKEADGKVHSRKIDVYVPSARVIIEMKGSDIDLAKRYKQSGGDMLTPYEQAKRYSDNIPRSQQGRYIITCNFNEFRIYDLDIELPESKPIVIRLDEMEEKYQVFTGIFSYSRREKDIIVEEQISTKAGELVGQLYDELKKLYPNAGKDKELNDLILKSLNILCVRFVFLFYAEDAGLFGTDEKLFQELVSSTPAEFLTAKFKTLFRVLNMKNDDPMRLLESTEMQAFPYVNGGLFAEENILIPQMTDPVKEFISHEAAEFDWSPISPTIFGAMFESTISARFRRSGGMHYTSIENIHKVIDPLFLDELTSEVEKMENERKHFEKIRKHGLTKNDIDILTQEVESFQKKLASITILDPACGSGNFLTEAYLSLRRLENRALKVAQGKQISIGFEDVENPIKVLINQFFGIEISGFACDVARTALWIAESQMYDETKSIVIGMKDDFLPLTSNHNIHKGNALRTKWEYVADKSHLKYIVGNPPFLGYSNQSKEQKEDLKFVYTDLDDKSYRMAGKVDYVTGWYIKAAKYIQNTPILCAFVSTSSITQGEQVPALWNPMIRDFGIHINFAYKPFVWESEATTVAQVFCVIIGFGEKEYSKKILFNPDGTLEYASNISPYLLDSIDITVESRRKPICKCPPMAAGFKAADHGYLVLSEKEYKELIKKEPKAIKWIRQYSMGEEFIKGIARYCLWLKDITPHELNELPLIKERVIKCKKWRSEQISTGDSYKLRDRPHLFKPCSLYQEGPYIAIPKVSTSKRKYIPMGFIENGMIPGTDLFTVFGADLYDFGILTSSIHMLWMRTVCGRLGSGYRYSNTVVYNTFIWPDCNIKQKKAIKKTARNIIEKRKLYPGNSYADLYDPFLMPADLSHAHKANDEAVMQAYGFSGDMSDEEIVNELMKMYQKKVEELENG